MLIVKILGTHVRIKDFKIKKNLKKNKRRSTLKQNKTKQNKSITGQLATRGLISGKMKPESVQNE